MNGGGTFAVVIAPRDGISDRLARLFIKAEPSYGALSFDREYSVFHIRDGVVPDREFLDLDGNILVAIKGGFASVEDAKTFVEEDAAQRHALRSIQEGASCH